MIYQGRNVKHSLAPTKSTRLSSHTQYALKRDEAQWIDFELLSNAFTIVFKSSILRIHNKNRQIKYNVIKTNTELSLSSIIQ